VVYFAWDVATKDRLKLADHKWILERATSEGWSEQQTLSRFRSETLAAVKRNDEILELVRSALRRELAATVVATALAASSLLRPLFS
jgi:hypothetical protein